jgi:hypothetical protein
MSEQRALTATGVLPEAIGDSGQSLYQLSRLCGVGPNRLSRFLRGERDLTGDAIDGACAALHLELVSEGPPLAKGKKPRRRLR